MQQISDAPYLLRMAGGYCIRPLLSAEVFLPNKWPFWSQTKFNPSTDITNLSGKIILVTGGNSGIGAESVLQLARHQPAKIYLAARSQSKAQDALAEIRQELKASGQKTSVDIEWLPLDLSSLESVQQAARTVLQKSNRLDTLILNAGVMAAPPSKTQEGYEIHLGTNHLGHFLLVRLLLPLLEKTASSSPTSDVRIVSVASEACFISPSTSTTLSLIRDQARLLAKGPMTRYGISKGLNVLFAAELARRHPSLTSVSAHPGLIMTNLYSTVNGWGRWLEVSLGATAAVIFDDVPRGALNQLYLAAGMRKEDVANGAYYTPVGKARANRWAEDQEAARALWEWSEREMERLGY